MSGADRVLEITVRHPRLKVDRKGVAAAVVLLDAHARKFRGGCPAGELSVAFLTDRSLAQLHADHLDDPSPTDVITFEGDRAHQQAGEICISADAAVRHSGPSPDRVSREMILYLVHGWLHLAGYDDLRPVAKRAMRRAEKRALLLLERSSAIPRFKLA